MDPASNVRHPRARRALVALCLLMLLAVAVAPAAEAAVPSWSSVATISLNRPSEGVFRPDGSEYWITQGRYDMVAVIDTKTHAVTHTIDLATGTFPSAIAMDPAGRFVIVTGGDSTAYKIDTTTYAVVDTYPIAAQGWSVAITPDGSGIYTAADVDPSVTSQHSVSYTNLSSGAPRTIIDVDPLSEGWSPVKALMSGDGSRVYVVQQNYRITPQGVRYSVIDTATNTITATHDIPGSYTGCFGYAAALDPATGKLYTLDEDTGVVSVTDVNTGVTGSTISTGTPAWSWCNQAGLSLNSTGTLLFVAEPSNNLVHVVDTTTGTVTHTFGPSDGLDRFSWSGYWSPDGCELYVSNYGTNGTQPPGSRPGTQEFPGWLSVFGVPCAPSAPVNPSITRGNGSLTVSYGAPDDHGSAITDYEYSLDGGATWVSAHTTGTSFKISGLTNGTAYSVLVRARNAYGAGPASDAVSGTPKSASKPSVRIVSARVVGGSRFVARVRVNGAGAVRVSSVLGGVPGCVARATAKRAGVVTVSCVLGESARARIVAGPVVLRVSARLGAAGAVARDASRVRVAQYAPTPVTG